jgi:hypothetical protein
MTTVALTIKERTLYSNKQPRGTRQQYYIGSECLASYRYPGIITRYAYDHCAPLDSARESSARRTQRWVFISAVLNTPFPLYIEITMYSDTLSKEARSFDAPRVARIR